MKAIKIESYTYSRNAAAICNQLHGFLAILLSLIFSFILTAKVGKKDDMVLDYEDGLSVSDENVRNDKVEILISGIWFVGDVAQYRVFFDELRSAQDEVEEFATSCTNIGWIFNCDEGNDLDPSYVDVRQSNRHSALPIPLFGGRLNLHRLNRDEGTWLRELRFTLQFNPSRLFAYQHLVSSYVNSDSYDLVEPRTLVRGRQFAIDGQNHRIRNPEFSLDGNDNFISRDPWMEVCTRDHWVEFLQSSLASVIEAYLTQIRRAYRIAVEDDSALIDRNGYRLTLKELESYVEVSPSRSLNPIEFVRRIMPALDRYAQTALREYNTVARYEEERLSPRVLLNIGRNREIAVYAKTDRRVRFEFRQTLDGIAGRRTAESPSGIIAHVTRQTPIAERHLNLLFGWLGNEVNWEESISRTPHYFIGQIYRYSQNPAIADLIISSLINTGSISPIGIPRVSTSIDRLTDAGILRATPNPARRANQSYTVASRYTNSLELLRSFTQAGGNI